MGFSLFLATGNSYSRWGQKSVSGPTFFLAGEPAALWPKGTRKGHTLPLWGQPAFQVPRALVAKESELRAEPEAG